jgi:hypothetical protein
VDMSGPVRTCPISFGFSVGLEASCLQPEFPARKESTAMHRPDGPAQVKSAPSTPTFAPDPPLYTVKGFCRVHHICRSTLYSLWDKGQGPAVVRVGRRVLIPGQKAQEWRQQLEDEAARKVKP